MSIKLMVMDGEFIGRRNESSCSTDSSTLTGKIIYRCNYIRIIIIIL